MQFINIDKLSFSYASQTSPLFDNLTFQLQQGWTGIVGPNGSGKTTLLKLLSGILTPDSGSARFQGTRYYCEQRTDVVPEQTQSFLASTESKVFKLKNILKIQDAWFDRWDSLSHGERKRCQIAIALFNNPALLSIDEPTNHLDNATRNILINAMQIYQGIGIMVSHDRELLDRLCTHTLFLDHKGLEIFKCNYSAAHNEREMMIQSRQNEHDLLNREIKKMKRKLGVQKEKTDQAKKLKSKRGIKRKDHDAKSKKDLARLTGKDAVAGQIYKRMQTQLERSLERRSKVQVSKSHELGIQFNPQQFKRYFPIIIKPDQIKLGKNRHVSYSELVIQNGDKIGLTGNNGSGKSTFINHFKNRLPFTDEQIVYIPQEISISQSEIIIKNTHELKNDEKGQIMTLIRRLGSDPVHVLETSIPSPGEVRKLLLAHGLMQNPAILVMDEPTNHMDLPSIECLESALCECDCTQILVSHDHHFLKNIVNTTWEFYSDKNERFRIRIKN